MWQSVLTVTTAKREIDYIEKCLSKIHQLNFIKKQTNAHTQYHLCANETAVPQIKAKLMDIISVLILSYYKFDYIVANLGLGQHNLAICAFVSCLMHFDYAYERNILDKVLEGQESYNVEGLINFRIEAIKSNWRELSELSEGMFLAGCTDSEIFSLMTFILSNSAKRNQKVYVTKIDSEHIVTNTTKSKVVENVGIFGEKTYDLIDTILSQTPVEVVFDNQASSSECIDVLKNFVRVKVLKKP